VLEREHVGPRAGVELRDRHQHLDRGLGVFPVGVGKIVRVIGSIGGTGSIQGRRDDRNVASLVGRDVQGDRGVPRDPVAVLDARVGGRLGDREIQSGCEHRSVLELGGGRVGAGGEHRVFCLTALCLLRLGKRHHQQGRGRSNRTGDAERAQPLLGLAAGLRRRGGYGHGERDGIRTHRRDSVRTALACLHVIDHRLAHRRGELADFKAVEGEHGQVPIAGEQTCMQRTDVVVRGHGVAPSGGSAGWSAAWRARSRRRARRLPTVRGEQPTTRATSAWLMPSTK